MQPHENEVLHEGMPSYPFCPEFKGCALSLSGLRTVKKTPEDASAILIDKIS